ncbi:MAG: Fic family protein [Pseudohongiellaceae bacterium]
MAKYNQNPRLVSVLHSFPAPEGTLPVGYAALIADHELAVPAPDHLCVIGSAPGEYDKERWQLFTSRYQPDNSLQGHLVFALKHEGINLTVLKALFSHIEARTITKIVHSEPTGAYARRIWFLYEWLCNTRLDLDDANGGNYASLINESLQYPGPNRKSKRHRITNNLPGTRAFCPMIRRTDKLDRFLDMNLAQTARNHIGKTHPDLLSRAAAYLLLEDSRASYYIEGEKPPHNRISQWGTVIGMAGQQQLSIAELERLQSIVIADFRFIQPGLRLAGGFIGDHDRTTQAPIPVHISARPDDLKSLLSGLIETCQLLGESDYDAVFTAALIAFGFVFIHPFEDGNGRIHRYLFHHVLASKGFVPTGLTFPISAVILDKIVDYRRILEHYSKPRLNLIEWRPTSGGNVDVLNETIDLYRYFDATQQAEFLFECIEETVNTTLPQEVDYLIKYDSLHEYINNHINMSSKQLDLLIRSLRQNKGKLSKRKRDKEFAALTEQEVQKIEQRYGEIFSE